MSNSEERQKAYLDSGASIHVTGDAKRLSNKRPSALQIQGYTNATWAHATAAGEWGPLKNVQCIDGAQNLVSSGSLLDDITHSIKAGIYSTTTDAYLLSGFDIHKMPAGSTATKIATRAGPGKLYETDIDSLSKAIHKHNDVQTQYGQLQQDPIICSLSHDHEHQLREELNDIRNLAQAEPWITPECHDRRQKAILQALFPTPSDNPWTDLPVHPRTTERAREERQAFVSATPQAHDDDENMHTNDRHVQSPKLKQTHDAIRSRLLTRHRALGHPSKRVLQHMLAQSPSQGDVDLASKVNKFMPFCDGCLFGKPKQKPHNKKSSGCSKATRYLQRLLIDCSGRQAVPTLQGCQYFMLIIDEYTRYTWVYFLKSVSECPQVIDNFLRKIGRCDKHGSPHVQTVQFIRSDGGPDFSSHKFEHVLDRYNIHHEHITADSSEQMGIVERKIGVVSERTRVCLHWAQLPQPWWGEAVKYVVQTLNLTPSYALGFTSPYYMRTGRQHSLTLLQPFGCLVCTYIKPVRRAAGKLSPAGQVGIFLSYHDRSDGGVQGYRVYHWDSGRVTNRYDCDFNPDLPAMAYISKMLTTSADAQFLNRRVCKKFNDGLYHGTVTKMHKGAKNQTMWHIQYDDGDREDVYFQELLQILVTDKSEVQKRIALQQPRLARDHTHVKPHTHETEGPTRASNKSHPTEGLRRSSRKSKQSNETPALDSTARYGTPPRGSVLHAKQIGAGMHPDDMVPEMVIDFKTTLARDLPKPKSYKDAMRGPLRRYWAKAVRKELDTMAAKGVWKIVSTPKDGSARRPIRLTWVLKIKKCEDSTVDKFRARLCGLGCRQRPGRDYRDKTAPVLHAVSLRSLLAMANELGWEVHQLDVSCAYLNAYLEPDIKLYLVPPEGMKLPPGHSLLGCKALYGLVQAGNRWAALKSTTLKRLNYKRNGAEPCMWIRIDGRGTVILGIIVDDFAITGHPTSAIKTAVHEIMTIWDCTYLGQIRWMLNMRITRQPGILIIDQSEYVGELLAQFGLSNAKPVSTPSQLGLHLSKNMSPDNQKDKQEMQRIPYANAVGKLLYIRLTRIDTLAAISECARFMSNPGMEHWRAVKRIMRYASGTRHWGLIYRSTRKGLGEFWIITVYVDSDHASDPDHRRSRYGYLILLNGCPVSFGTGMRKQVSASTPEAEYVALAHALKELLWLMQILTSMGIKIALPIHVHEDNQTCITIANNHMSQRRTRYIDIRYHFIRDYTQNGTIKLIYCQTKNMLADILTKALPKPQHEKLRNQILTDVLQFIGSDLLTQAAYCKALLASLTL